MKTDWSGSDETLVSLGRWTTTFKNIHLLIEFIPDVDLYIWSNNLTGVQHRTGESRTLDRAMLAAIGSVNES